MSNIMTFLVYETMDWEFDNVIAVASTYEKALELLVEKLNSGVYLPENEEDFVFDDIHIDAYRIVQTVIDDLRGNTNEIRLFLDNQKVIQHSKSKQFQVKDNGCFTVDAVKSMLESHEEWKYGVAS